MPSYLSWDEKIITDFSEETINNLYNEGYVFTRKERGVMYQTRSLRINLENFKLSSENRRILKKIENITLRVEQLPYQAYDWSIGKLGKDFYTTKFGDGTFSANKIKELLTDKEKSNFNRLFIYSLDTKPIGYCIVLETHDLIHYCYPFYDLNTDTPNLGLGMMLQAIVWAQEHDKKYIYLGSAQRPTDTYKLQFEGLEWFDGNKWQTNLEELKNILLKGG
jgi:arginyl-tRNA--protein-N-Asp/Glu arginylyltransferase